MNHLPAVNISNLYAAIGQPHSRLKKSWVCRETRIRPLHELFSFIQQRQMRLIQNGGSSGYDVRRETIGQYKQILLVGSQSS